MKILILLLGLISSAGISGCISFGSDTRGPPGPQGPPGASEKIIVVPEKDDDKKVIVVPEK